jgi:hypothetical protein
MGGTMNPKNITFDEAIAALNKGSTGNVLRQGFKLAKGAVLSDDDNEQIGLTVWLNALKPKVKLINDAIDMKVPLEGELSLPIGLSIITGQAGSGKTSWLRESVIPNIPDSMIAHFLKIGEPGYIIPYHIDVLLNVIEEKVKSSVEQGVPGILLIDSLLGLWFDPVVTKGFAAGKGGASLGVPVLLQVIGQFALANGYRIVAVLHPVFADPEVIGSGISGVSSFFLNRDSNSFILRDYTKVQIEDDGVISSISDIPYTRREMNMAITHDNALNLLAQTIGDED